MHLSHRRRLTDSANTTTNHYVAVTLESKRHTTLNQHKRKDVVTQGIKQSLFWQEGPLVSSGFLSLFTKLRLVVPPNRPLTHFVFYQKTLKQHIESLVTHRVNTLTELRRIEQVAASCENEADARAFQEPMTAAWCYYVNSNQFLTELRGLTPNYPFSGEILMDAQQRVISDPLSDRSWNMAWLCLSKIHDDGLIPLYAASEAHKPEMWGDYQPQPEECEKLAQCFEYEWTQAVATMLRHWSTPPTWY